MGDCRVYFRFLTWAAVFFMLVCVDQSSKALVVSNFQFGHIYGYFSGASVYPVWNSGIAFGMFSDHTFLSSVCISLGILVNLVVLMVMISFGRQDRRLLFALICIFSGGCSNLIDRSIYGAVVDFMLLSYHDWVFPVFNLADVFISFGALQMMVWMIYTQYYSDQFRSSARLGAH